MRVNLNLLFNDVLYSPASGGLSFEFKKLKSHFHIGFNLKMDNCIFN